MKKLNLNKLAKEIAEKEGKKKNLNIADIKEVMGILFRILARKYRNPMMRVYRKPFDKKISVFIVRNPFKYQYK